MKDIVIKKDQIFKEMKWYLYCLGGAFFLNVYSIMTFNTRWMELITTLHITALLSVFFYAVTGSLRLVYFAAKKLLFHRNKKLEI